MRILFISDNFPPFSHGGANISTSLLVKELSKKYKCFVLTQQFQKTPWYFGKVKVYPLLKEFSPKFNSIKEILSRGVKNIFSFQNKSIIKKFIKKNKIDIIQIQTNNISLLRQVLSLNKPVVIDIRDTALVCPIMFRKIPCTKKCVSCLVNYFREKYSLRLKILPFFVLLFLTTFKLQRALLIKNIKENEKVKIVAVSNFIKEKLYGLGIPKAKIEVIYNISQLSKSKVNRRKNKIVFAGIIEKPKGIFDAIKAFEILNDKDLIFEIAGDGPDLSNVKNYVSKKNLENIKILGKLLHENINELYSESKIILAPSIIPEGFGRYILESIASKTPIITTPVGGNPEGIKHKKTGMLVEPNNPEQLASAIKELLENEKLYNKIVKNLDKEACKYSPEKIEKERLELYEKFIEGSK